MKKRYYVMEENGPYNWKRATLMVGPYYDDENVFKIYGYDNEEDAEKAIAKALEIKSEVYFVIAGYSN